MSYKSGEKPGKGRYRCRQCYLIVELDEDSDELPECPKCRDCIWDEI